MLETKLKVFQNVGAFVIGFVLLIGFYKFLDSVFPNGDKVIIVMATLFIAGFLSGQLRQQSKWRLIVTG